jgi:hypothetical protein
MEARLVTQNTAIITSKYSTARMGVASFIRADLLRTSWEGLQRQQASAMDMKVHPHFVGAAWNAPPGCVQGTHAITR